jgi:hypothetical protein
MHNKTHIWVIIGIGICALAAVAVYWPRAASNDEPIPEPAVTEGVVCGSVVVPESITQLTADGANGSVAVELDQGVGQLPVGKYRIASWRAERKDEQGAVWTLSGRPFGPAGRFEIMDGARTNLDVGEPIVATVHGTKIGPKYYSFTQSLQGRLDEGVAVTRGGARPGAPKLRIKNKDGTYDKTFAFQYG